MQTFVDWSHFNSFAAPVWTYGLNSVGQDCNSLEATFKLLAPDKLLETTSQTCEH